MAPRVEDSAPTRDSIRSNRHRDERVGDIRKGVTLGRALERPQRPGTLRGRRQPLREREHGDDRGDAGGVRQGAGEARPAGRFVADDDAESEQLWELRALFDR